jgi:hypothetical protein
MMMMINEEGWATSLTVLPEYIIHSLVTHPSPDRFGEPHVTPYIPCDNFLQQTTTQGQGQGPGTGGCWHEYFG